MTGAIIHEWIASRGGAERVLDAMVAAYPDSDVFCLWNDDPHLNSSRVTESYIARTPLRGRKALALPIMPLIWRQLNAKTEYEWMLVSSHLFAHHARFSKVSEDIPKYVYAHTPARYIWEPSLDPRGNSPIARATSALFKPVDRRRAQEAFSVAANSSFIAERIRRTWHRDATVIYPPVDVGRISSRDWFDCLSGQEMDIVDSLPRQFLLGASRFVDYKRLDLVIRTGEAAKLPVVLAGSGPMEQSIRELAGQASVPVEIISSPTDELLFALYQKCVAYVFPPIEDFGIMPVEAMAAGAPVIANNLGGASESVMHGVTGYLTDFSDTNELRRAVDIVSSIERTACQVRARNFGIDIFQSEVAKWIGR